MDYLPITVDDIPQVTAIYNDYILNGVESFETEPLTNGQMVARVTEISGSHPYFVAKEKGRVAGFCYAHPWKERAAYRHTYETTIYLHPNYLHKGVGTALMTKLISACRQQGCKALIACITGENKASISFHGSLGFKQVSLFSSVGYKFNRWLDVVDMELILY